MEVKMKQIDANKNVGYSGEFEGQELTNGEVGIDPVKKVLVVCCGNCGDYKWIDLYAIAKGTE